MPLSEFVRYLNAQQQTACGLPSTTPFVAEDGQVSVHFAKLRLESLYSPIVDLGSGELNELHGHAAGLNVFGLNNHRRIEPEAIFVLPSDDEQFVYLDRLVRTLHTLNYLTYRNHRARGTLLLRVHPRHLANTSAGHGLAFEEVLRSCGLLPEQITLEIEIDGVDDVAHLLRAVDGYKLRGYGIAVGRFGRREINLELLHEVGPAIVKFDPLLAESVPALAPLVGRIHDFGARAMIEGVDGGAVRSQAEAAGIDLLQVRTPPQPQAVPERLGADLACA